MASDKTQKSLSSENNHKLINTYLYHQPILWVLIVYIIINTNNIYYGWLTIYIIINITYVNYTRVILCKTLKMQKQKITVKKIKYNYENKK